MDGAVLDLLGQLGDLAGGEEPGDAGDQAVGLAEVAGQLRLEPVELALQLGVLLQGDLEGLLRLGGLADDRVQVLLGLDPLGLDLGPGDLDQAFGLVVRLEMVPVLGQLDDHLAEQLILLEACLSSRSRVGRSSRSRRWPSSARTSATLSSSPACRTSPPSR